VAKATALFFTVQHHFSPTGAFQCVKCILPKCPPCVPFCKSVNLVVAHDDFLLQQKLSIFFMMVTLSTFILLCNKLNMAENEVLWILQFSGNNWDAWCHLMWCMCYNTTCITVYIENARYTLYVLFCNCTVNSQ